MTVNAKIFWAAGSDKIAPVEVQLPLSADPVERSGNCSTSLQLTLPRRGSARFPPMRRSWVSTFSRMAQPSPISPTPSSEMPSGILSEEMAVNSIAHLGSNVPVLHRLKILIHGQEVDTLAGNVDFTGFFDLNPAVAPSTGAPATPAKSAH